VVFYGLFESELIKTSVNQLCANMLMISYFFKILSIECQGMLVVRVDLAQCKPQLIDILCSQVYFLAKLIQHVKVRYECSQVSPELDLEVRHDFDRFRHILIESLKLDDIGQLWIDLFMFQVLGLNKVLDDLLVAKDGKLLLERGLLFEGYIKFEKRLMDVVHDFEKVERECDVDVG
jgi:hypothetical protein